MLGKIVYCIDRDNPYFGNRFRVEYAPVTHDPIFIHLTSGSQITFDLTQVSEKQPAGMANREKKNDLNNYDLSMA